MQKVLVLTPFAHGFSVALKVMICRDVKQLDLGVLHGEKGMTSAMSEVLFWRRSVLDSKLQDMIAAYTTIADKIRYESQTSCCKT